MTASNLILQTKIKRSEDIIYVRQRSRQLGILGGLTPESQNRFVTAVAEISRNALQHAGGGTVRFSLIFKDDTYRLEACIEDHGKGIECIEEILQHENKPIAAPRKGIIGAKTLVHGFNIESGEKGTKVWLEKILPAPLESSMDETIRIWTSKLVKLAGRSAIDELLDQNQQLLHALTEAHDSKTQLSQQQILLEEKTKELEKANRLKADFVSNISHEMRTPLNAIIGISDILHKTNLDKHQKFLVNSLDSSGRNLLALINDILDLSKLEAGKFDIEDIAFTFSDAINEALTVVQPQALEKYIDLMLFLGPHLPTNTTGDPHRLQQVIINIVANAIKFSEQSSEIQIFVFNNGISENAVEVRFVVFDSGIGISEQHQGQLFEAFSQVDGSGSRNYGGSGLGLSISRQLLSLMGGKIGFFSREGHGTAFWFNVPFKCDNPDEPRFRQELNSFEVIFTENKLQNFELLLNTLGIKTPRVKSAHNAKKLEPASGKTLILIDQSTTEFASSKPSGLFNHLMTHLNLPYKISSFRSGQEKDFISKKTFLEKLSNCGTALLIEDHALNQMIGRLQLESLGFKVEVCSNGKDAIKSVMENQYSIIFVDCQMPGMDGYEVTKKIRKIEHESRRYTPIVAITASMIERQREKCLAAGMDDCLTKPVEPELLFATCQKWLRHTEVIDPINAPQNKNQKTKSRSTLEQLVNIIDQKRLLKQFSPDQTDQLIRMYSIDSEKALAQLAQHIEAKNAPGAIALTHTLQGASRVIFANTIADNYKDLGSALRAGNWVLSDEILSRIEDQVKQLTLALQRI